MGETATTGSVVGARLRALSLAIAIAAAVVVVVVGTFLLPRPRWPDAASLPLTAIPRELGTVAKTGGVVQRQEHGAWVDVAAGEKLFEGAKLRAGAASFGWVDLGGGRARVQVAADSEVVLARGADGPSLELVRGAVRVPAGAAGTVLVKVAGGPISADGGPLSVALGAAGLDVRSQSAHPVRLAVAGGELALAEGDVAHAPVGGEAAIVERHPPPPPPAATTTAATAPPPAAPAQPRPRIDRPAKVAHSDTTVVTGKVDRSAIAVVTVAGVSAEVADDGTFKAVVPLKVGVNAIAIVTRDVFGNEDVYEIDPVRRLSDEEIRALKFEWQKHDDGSATTWGVP